MTLAWILVCILAGSIGALAVAGSFLLFPDQVRRRFLPLLVSYATGSLLGGAFLGLIPHALEHEASGPVLAAVFGGFVLFFILEKLVIWRHCHVAHCDIHSAAGPLIIIGDSVHNFVDGVIIAAAFLNSTELGIAATIAVIAHEIPQEVGDFAILLDSGYSVRRALVLNVASSLTSLIGGLGAYFLLRQVQVLLPYVMAVSAASFIYIAAADLIPGLHRQSAPKHALQQILLLTAGAATIWLFHH
ncbi:ZIP zinc transporter [candidate division GN15 bacterium]|uniref:ZIP zinc transporter n=1 Tax=candidate division GN15 bacterium TaxID=2072418 RepID=A0A855X8Q4_9BACT|nr:MAG: ZIP zinc transporter [candidate division GN15 bacterium]